MMRHAWIWITVLVAGCGGETLSTTDGGMDGSAGRDARVLSDAADRDARTDGGSEEDAGSTDGGGEDASTADGSTGDAGTSDGGPVSVACTSNDECMSTELCAAASCEGEGTCEPRPELSDCPDVVDLVCGCDGVTYDNACEAAAAGQNVARRGACPAGECVLPPRGGCCFEDGDCAGRSRRCVREMCVEGGEGTCVSDLLDVGRCWEDSDCDPGTTCEDARICACGMLCLVDDQPGVCRSPAPERCTDSSTCADAGQYCAQAVGDCGGEGECLDRPRICEPFVDPVCGCDGVTYQNDCLAARAGTSVASRGACDRSCGLDPEEGCCFDDGDCPGRDQRCAEEVCRAGGEGMCVSTRLEVGRCWEDSDCRRGATCVGATICPCGAVCVGPDTPGRCAIPL